MLAARFVALLSCAALAGCAEPDAGDRDAATLDAKDELEVGVEVDASADAETNSGSDAALDAGFDAGSDTGRDAEPAGSGCDRAHVRSVPVATADELTAALADAVPGDSIELADGTYLGTFTLTSSGTESDPIVVCGSRAAVLDGESTTGGYVFHLQASHVVLTGFSITNGQKGLMLDGADHNLLEDLEVHQIGDEAVHFRSFSSDNVLRASYIHHTGLRRASFGEGVYLGSANSNWDTYSGGEPDASDRNQVLDNRITDTTAESIDIKEGTTGGVIEGNTFDGAALSGENFADSWVDVKGNGYRLERNTGVTSIADGFQLHSVVSGWGDDNLFLTNTAQVDGPGYGFLIQNGTSGNVVACDNTVSGAAQGLANVACE